MYVCVCVCVSVCYMHLALGLQIDMKWSENFIGVVLAIGLLRVTQ